MKVRVVGVGSPSGDDQAGWLVIDALRALGAAAIHGVTLVKADRPGAALFAELEGAEHVMLVDAMQSGGAPGGIRHVRGDDWRQHAHGLSSHGFGVMEALALASALDSLPPRLDLYGIEIGEASPGASPGAAVYASAQQLAAGLLAVLRGEAGGR